LKLGHGCSWRSGAYGGRRKGLPRSVTTLLGLAIDVPDNTTLSRRTAALSLATALIKTAGPVTMATDSTGLKVFGAGEWHMAKHGGRDWRTTWPSIQTQAKFSLRH
jgi:Transposase DDE domain